MTDDLLAPFREKFRLRCQNSIVALEAVLPRDAAIDWKIDWKADVLPVVHSISGTAGMFGYAELGVQAANYEALLVAEPPSNPIALLAGLNDFLATLRTVGQA